MEDLKDIYFSHDAGARNDPKCRALIQTYGMLGYGWFWTIVEMLRQEERAHFKLSMHEQYIWNAIAEQNKVDVEHAKKFVRECIDVFKLFATDEDFFWSDSLLRRMERREKIREKRRNSANQRWKNANALHSQSKSNARKGKKSKGKESKDLLSPLIPLSFSAHPGFAESLDGFVDMRKRLRKPLTERALKILVAKLRDLSSEDPATAIKLLDTATESSWLTVWPLKEDHGNTSRQSTSGNPTSTERNARKADDILARVKAGSGGAANRDLFQDDGQGDTGEGGHGNPG